jgi:hypothetical protein
MPKKKLKSYTVRLGATLPCTASLEVEALDEEDAKQVAYDRWADADWSGSDIGDRPYGSDVEVISVEAIK